MTDTRYLQMPVGETGSQAAASPRPLNVPGPHRPWAILTPYQPRFVNTAQPWIVLDQNQPSTSNSRNEPPSAGSSTPPWAVNASSAPRAVDGLKLAQFRQGPSSAWIALAAGGQARNNATIHPLKCGRRGLQGSRHLAEKRAPKNKQLQGPEQYLPYKKLEVPTVTQKSKGSIIQTSKWFLLPGEVRNKIYKLVFPETDYEIRWCRTKRTRTHVEFLKDRLSMDQSLPWSVAPTSHRYWSLNFSMPTIGSESVARRNFMNRVPPAYRDPSTEAVLPSSKAALILTCRPIHDEACNMLYSRSTFGFSSPRTLQAFVSAINPIAQKSIQRIFLYQTTNGDPAVCGWNREPDAREGSWLHAFRKAADLLTDLKDLRLMIYANEDPCNFPVLQRWPDWCAPVLAFRQKRLEELQIILWCQDFCSEDEGVPKLGVFARNLRKEVLGDAYVGEPEKRAMEERKLPAGLGCLTIN